MARTSGAVFSTRLFVVVGTTRAEIGSARESAARSGDRDPRMAYEAGRMGQFEASASRSVRGATVILLGLDPGVNGAFAAVDDAGQVIALHDLPIIRDGKRLW